MDDSPITQGAIPEHYHDSVTRKLLRERAVELAVADGGTALDVLKSHWEQAKRELSPD